MHTKSLVKRLFGIDKIAVEDVYFDTIGSEEIAVVRVRPYTRELNRCPICGKVCSKYDRPTQTKRWRSLDFGSKRVYIEAIAPRIICKEHGVKVARVPWARHDSEYTYDFEMAVTWSALHMTATDVSEFFRIKWHTVGSISRRVQQALEAEAPGRFDNLEEIGIDETSYKKGHKYMTVVVNHKTGQLIWAAKGHGKDVLSAFFEELTEEQRANIKYVTADGAKWISETVKEYCVNAERCIDPFHVVAWATDSLDEVRRSVARQAVSKAATAGADTKEVKKKGIPRASATHY